MRRHLISFASDLFLFLKLMVFRNFNFYRFPCLGKEHGWKWCVLFETIIHSTAVELQHYFSNVQQIQYFLSNKNEAIIVKSWTGALMSWPRHSEVNRELKQTRRRRERERHLKIQLHVYAIIFQLFKVIMLEKCLLTVLELIWNQCLGRKKTKISICDRMLRSSTQLQNRSFHDIERTRTSSKCQKMKKMHVQSLQKYCFSLSNMQICGVFVPVVVVVA